MHSEYLAGFFDGEGCININVRGKNNQVCLRCDIVNTNVDILREIQLYFGGNLYQRPHKYKLSWKPFSNLMWFGAGAANLIRTMRPHLRLKKPQAELALEFWEFMHLPRKQRCVVIPGIGNGNLYQRSPETLVRELDFKARMHALNRKGQSHALLRSDGEIQAGATSLGLQIWA